MKAKYKDNIMIFSLFGFMTISCSFLVLSPGIPSALIFLVGVPSLIIAGACYDTKLDNKTSKESTKE